MRTIVSYSGRDVKRLTRLIIGDIYECQPINPSATKNRGRQAVLVELDQNPFKSDPQKNATVRWTDTNRMAVVDIGSFIHISDVGKTSEELKSEAKKYVLERVNENHGEE